MRKLQKGKILSLRWNISSKLRKNWFWTDGDFEERSTNRHRVKFWFLAMTRNSTFEQQIWHFGILHDKERCGWHVLISAAKAKYPGRFSNVQPIAEILRNESSEMIPSESNNNDDIVSSNKERISSLKFDWNELIFSVIIAITVYTACEPRNWQLLKFESRKCEMSRNLIMKWRWRSMYVKYWGVMHQVNTGWGMIWTVDDTESQRFARLSMVRKNQRSISSRHNNCCSGHPPQGIGSFVHPLPGRRCPTDTRTRWWLATFDELNSRTLTYARRYPRADLVFLRETFLREGTTADWFYFPEGSEQLCHGPRIDSWPA